MSDKHHILILSSWFPTAEEPFLGNFVIFQANLLARDYNVSFIRLFSDRQQIKSGIENDVKFRFIDVVYRKSWNPLITYLSKRKALKKALALAGEVQLIHAHVSYPDGWLFRLAKKQLNRPMVLTEHGSYWGEGRKWDARMRNAVVNAVRSADVLVAVSSFLAGDINKRFPEVKPVVIGNPVDLEQFRITGKPAECIDFLHISTLDKIKNVEPVIRAFSNIVKRFPGLRLTIVSDTDYTDCQELADSLGVAGSIFFCGPVAHDDVSGFYQKADCLIMNSLYESFSIVIAEAWASGIPVISTPVGIATGMTADLGILTDGTEQEIERAIQTYLERKGDFDPVVIRKHAARYSTENILQKLKAVYERLLS